MPIICHGRMVGDIYKTKESTLWMAGSKDDSKRLERSGQVLANILYKVLAVDRTCCYSPVVWIANNRSWIEEEEEEEEGRKEGGRTGKWYSRVQQAYLTHCIDHTASYKVFIELCWTLYLRCIRPMFKDQKCVFTASAIENNQKNKQAMCRTKSKLRYAN